MRALKWVFHPVTVLLMLAAVALYINRDAFFPNNHYSVEVETILNKVDSLIDDLQSEHFDTTSRKEDRGGDSIAETFQNNDMPPIDGVSEMAGKDNVVSPASTLPAGNSEAPLPMVEAVSEGGSGVSLPSMLKVDKERGESAPHGVTGLAENGKDAVAIRAGERDDSVEETGDSEGRVQLGPLTHSSEQLWKIWQKARFSAWHGDTATALASYREIIALQPDNYDAYGEMGNVLMSTGDTDGAAEAYYEAAKRLNKTEHRRMAWQLLNVIARLSPAKADKLYQELNQP